MEFVFGAASVAPCGPVNCNCNGGFSLLVSGGIAWPVLSEELPNLPHLASPGRLYLPPSLSHSVGLDRLPFNLSKFISR